MKNSATTHTPGPWSYNFRNDDDTCDLTADHGIRHANARLFGEFAAMRANARLIAAAPDLLSSIEYVLPWLSDLSSEWESMNRDNHGGVNRAQIVISNLKSAIAKARGEG